MPRSDPAHIALAPARPFGWLSAVSDRWIVASALSTAAGALWAPTVSWWWGAAAGAIGLATRARALIPVGLLVLGAASMGAQTTALQAATSASLEGEAVLAADPEWRAGALVVPFSAEADGKRFRWEGWARGPAAWTLEDAAMGERWRLSARAEPAEDGDRAFMWPRHLAGSAQIHTAQRIDPGTAPFRLANSLRDLIAESGSSLSQRDAALLAGFVYGDDRGQLPEVVHDFRATSLTHLLAVSGSNVAFVLLLFAPLLVRLRPLLRLGAVGLLLAQFAVLTRGEPSVLRACVLATLAVGAHAIGRRASAPRLLATAIIVLLLVDPLLVRSVGFQLSVAATAAIVFGAGRLAGLLWGPPWLRLALAATLTAQAGVLPVQLAVFGSLPLASIPANVLAGPVAGPAMVWGLVGGIAGGLAGDAVAALVHLPTKLMLGWVAAVARWGAGLGWPSIEPSEIVGIVAVAGAAAVVGAVAAAVAGSGMAAALRGRHRKAEPPSHAPAQAARETVSRKPVSRHPVASDSASREPVSRKPGSVGHRGRERRTTRRVRSVAIAAVAIGTWIVAGTHRPPPPMGAHLAVPQIDPTVVVVDRPDAARSLDRLATAGIDDIDVLIARSASRAGREAVRALAARHEIGQVLAPEGLGGSVPYTPVRQPVTVGGLRIVPSAKRLEAAPAAPAAMAPAAAAAVAPAAAAVTPAAAAVASEGWQAEP